MERLATQSTTVDRTWGEVVRGSWRDASQEKIHGDGNLQQVLWLLLILDYTIRSYLAADRRAVYEHIRMVICPVNCAFPDAGSLFLRVSIVSLLFDDCSALSVIELNFQYEACDIRGCGLLRPELSRDRSKIDPRESGSRYQDR